MKASHRWVIKKKETGFQFTQDWVQCLAFLPAMGVILGTLLITKYVSSHANEDNNISFKGGCV